MERKQTHETVDLSVSDHLDETRPDGPPAAPRRPSTNTLSAQATRAAVEQRLLGEGPTTAPQLGRFRVLRRIGSGAMGVVYEAHDPDLDRRVAIKVLRADVASRTDLCAEPRMLREAQALARLRHPHVTMVYEIGRTEADELFIAMELVEGRTLKQWLRGRRRSWREIVRVFVQAGRGLAAVHDAGLVHRDFKPDNLIVDDNGEARVVDFGLARPAGLAEFLPTLDGDGAPIEQLEQLELTATGAMLGTPAYMAPEQFDGGALRPASDQFSFCVALFEALYGRRPYPGNDLRTLQRSLLDGTIVPPRGGVPKRLYRILCRGVSIESRGRFADMRALVEELERCLSRPRLGRPLAWMAGLTLAGAVAAFGPSPSVEDSVESGPSLAAVAQHESPPPRR